jgi:hypothetical protein
VPHSLTEMWVPCIRQAAEAATAAARLEAAQATEARERREAEVKKLNTVIRQLEQQLRFQTFDEGAEVDELEAALATAVAQSEAAAETRVQAAETSAAAAKLDASRAVRTARRNTHPGEVYNALGCVATNPAVFGASGSIRHIGATEEWPLNESQHPHLYPAVFGASGSIRHIGATEEWPLNESQHPHLYPAVFGGEWVD